ncbi:MAG: hypothetical protein ACYCOU_03335 [Sulfobacillus sp.]
MRALTDASTGIESALHGCFLPSAFVQFDWSSSGAHQLIDDLSNRRVSAEDALTPLRSYLKVDYGLPKGSQMSEQPQDCIENKFDTFIEDLGTVFIKKELKKIGLQ